MALDGLPEIIAEETEAKTIAGDQSSLLAVCGSELELVEFRLSYLSSSFSLCWEPPL